MTTEHCSNPDCVSCNYKRDHPEDPYRRITLIYAQMLRITVGAMAEGKHYTEQLMPVLEAAGEVDVTQVYNRVVKQRLGLVLSDNAGDVLALVSVLGQLLPAGVLAHAKELHHTMIQREAKGALAEGRVDEESVKDAMGLMRQYQADLESVGKQYLSDTPPAISPTHCAPGGLQ